MRALGRIMIAAMALLAAAPAMAQLSGGGGLLEPDKAFRVSARALDERNVEITFTIARGYYMYRDRFSSPPRQVSRWPRSRSRVAGGTKTSSSARLRRSAISSASGYPSPRRMRPKEASG